MHQVFDHAHPVFETVSLIEVFQICAWKIIALETIFSFFILEIGAGFYLASDACDWFAGIRTAASRAWIYSTQVSATDSAVHPAGGNQKRRCCSRHLGMGFGSWCLVLRDWSLVITMPAHPPYERKKCNMLDKIKLAALREAALVRNEILQFTKHWEKQQRHRARQSDA